MPVRARDLAPPLLTRAAKRAQSRFRESRARGPLRSADRLHLGCGPRILSGWANLDRDGGPGSTHVDLTRPLPVASGTIKYIYSEHFIEHISRAQARKLLAECHRALGAGGVIRLSTPDLAFMVECYQAGSIDEWSEMDWVADTPCQLINEGLRKWGHTYVYDEAELTAALDSVGFRDVHRVEWRESDHEALVGLESRPSHHDLILEGTKGDGGRLG